MPCSRVMHGRHAGRGRHAARGRRPHGRASRGRSWRSALGRVLRAQNRVREDGCRGASFPQRRHGGRVGQGWIGVAEFRRGRVTAVADLKVPCVMYRLAQARLNMHAGGEAPDGAHRHARTSLSGLRPRWLATTSLTEALDALRCTLSTCYRRRGGLGSGPNGVAEDRKSVV